MARRYLPSVTFLNGLTGDPRRTGPWADDPPVGPRPGGPGDRMIPWRRGRPVPEASRSGKLLSHWGSAGTRDWGHQCPHRAGDGRDQAARGAERDGVTGICPAIRYPGRFDDPAWHSRCCRPGGAQGAIARDRGETPMGAQSASRQASGRVNDSVSGECRRLGKGRATATRRRVPFDHQALQPGRSQRGAPRPRRRREHARAAGLLVPWPMSVASSIPVVTRSASGLASVPTSGRPRPSPSSGALATANRTTGGR